MPQIFLDFNGSTPLAAEVVESMQPYLRGAYGNPASSHWAGREARRAIEDARSDVAALIGSRASEMTFTSGGSESNNLALKGRLGCCRNAVRHIITTRIEHPSVTQTCRFLETRGVDVSYVPVDGTGLVDPDDVRKLIRTQTVLISVMHANNEVGTIQPIAEIGRLSGEHGIPFHTDAAQTVGKIEVDVDALHVDLLTIAGHKMYGPKGVGALFVREGVQLEPLIHGGGQEFGRRAGSESAVLIAGLGAAARLAKHRGADEKTLFLRDRLWALLRKSFGDRVVLNGHPTKRLRNTLSVSFVGQDAASLLASLPDVAASTGSACHAGSTELSPVLEALGKSEELGRDAIRFSLGRTTTQMEVEAVVGMLCQRLTSSSHAASRKLPVDEGSSGYRSIATSATQR